MQSYVYHRPRLYAICTSQGYYTPYRRLRYLRHPVHDPRLGQGVNALSGAGLF